GKFASEFSVRSNIVTIVDDSQVDKVINTILDTVSTGSTGDGKIFISSISEAIDIGTKKRGEVAV
ncbi:MAG: P-II family nitrogen regulator, partial [Thermoproteota archaeon]|nr:P-II family nitrogen regulator [Thermoproteota archaeon]